MNNTLSHKTASIMLVDDNQDSLNLIEKLLTSRGYVSYKITTGTHAISFAKNAQPDLIFLDITMPDMDGFEICRQLKADKKSENIPIIFMSAIHNTIDIRKALSVGGEDYITKPIDIDRLLNLVEIHLKNGHLIKSLSI
jgi:DNA-binding response OmpR family regulator